MSGSSVFDFPNCYVCGPENPQGLHIEFHADGPERCRALYTARRQHEGWPGIVHGGVIFTLMDEALAWSLAYAGLRGVTAKGDVRFCAPAKVGAELVVTAHVRERRGKLVRARAEVRWADTPDVLIAELDATMYLTDVEQWQA